MQDTKQLTHLEKIAQLTHYEMCSLYRFAPAGHPYFIRDTPEEKAFSARYEIFGGMTPEMSRALSD